MPSALWRQLLFCAHLGLWWLTGWTFLGRFHAWCVRSKPLTPGR
jgi:hypothetical protein